MIKYVTGNILESNADAIVNPVNCVGVMGKGLALEFKQAYPQMFEDYKRLCKEKSIELGSIYYYTNPFYDKMIILFPTKEHYKEKSDIMDIVNGLRYFTNTINENPHIKSVAFPKLGCGLGGLNWDEVKKIMEFYLKDLDIDVYIYI